VACEEPHYQGDYCKDHFDEWISDGSPEEWRPKVPVVPLTPQEFHRLRVEALERIATETKVRAQIDQLTMKLAEMRTMLLARAKQVFEAFDAAQEVFQARLRQRSNERRKVPHKARDASLDATAIAVMQRARTRELYAQRKAEALAGSGPTCMIADCVYPHSSNGLCVTHYGQWVRDGRPYLATWTPYVAEEAKPCLVPDCEITAVGRGYCKKHWQKWKLLGFPEGWRGEGYKIRRSHMAPIRKG
jgi:hypothetical protein